jgi:plasmid stabilization system protein ParE
VYRLEYLPSAEVDIIEAETYLDEFSTAAVDKFTAAISNQMATLTEYPHLYSTYADDERFHCMPLPYEYLCFYRVDETTKILTIHRIIRGMRDIPSML